MRQKTPTRDAPSISAASSSSRGSAMRKGRRITTVTGSANAAWGSATPHQVLESWRSRVTRMNSGMIATASREEQAEHEDHEERLAEAELGSAPAGTPPSRPAPTATTVVTARDDHRVQRRSARTSGLVRTRRVVVEAPRVGEPGRVAGELLVGAEAAQGAVDDRPDADGDDGEGHHVDQRPTGTRRRAPGRSASARSSVRLTSSLTSSVSRRSTRRW